ncbi:DUF6653 family protein [Nonomuraea turcica]|uniref:DUF6653 family protein n=1 Tax=Nonomuraea sp. G32 TaxID=3067274 RepID=UPI00273CB992|nr:DUF6653 family protein [Nonomuraea sp. G32]MDP4510559.1 hypothetical protein [Nonomuraea sp. G32]
MSAKQGVAQTFGMTDQAWKRHANPWSVWTRFAAIPAMETAVWSRAWLGWWCLIGVAAVIAWLWLNVHIFGPVEPVSWAAKGIYGEQLHVTGHAPRAHQRVLRWLIAAGLAGFGFIAWGLAALSIWPLIFGTTLLVLAQLWRIDRYGLLFEQHQSDAASRTDRQD